MSILPNERDALSTLKDLLEKKYNLRDFRIYGSKVKGSDSPESDVDVMIELEDSSPIIESEIDDLIFRLNIRYDCLITAVYFSRKELEEGPLGESPLYKAILCDGINP
jgi:predicted nucleotidyltransferase